MKVPARDVPVPSTLSPEAQAVLALPVRDAVTWPAREDHAAWQRHIDAEHARYRELIPAAVAGVEAEVTERAVGDGRVWVVRPAGTPAGDPYVWLDVHGGAFITGSGDIARALAIRAAGRRRATVWGVDYRMPPQHPYPAPLDDCVAAYRAVLAEHAPEHVIVAGASAGGNLAAALVLRARDEGLPLPRACVLMTPEADLTESGDTFATNLGIDPHLRELMAPVNELYADGHDLRDPLLSPLFADFTRGFPPTLLTSGTRDLFLSNTVLLHRALRRAGVPAELHVLEGGGHSGFLGTAPEDRELDREVQEFAERMWGR